MHALLAQQPLPDVKEVLSSGSHIRHDELSSWLVGLYGVRQHFTILTLYYHPLQEPRYALEHIVLASHLDAHVDVYDDGGDGVNLPPKAANLSILGHSLPTSCRIVPGAI